MSESNTPALVPLTSQVGGHSGVSTTEDGSLLIKPALANEVNFYQSLTSDANFAALRPYVPKFFGTLRLQGTTEDGDVEAAALKVLQEGVKEDKDIKLGTVLYDEDASSEKRARMEAKAADSTSFETGVRLTGFQVYDNATGKAVIADRSYGKSLKAAELPDGIAKFFPLASEGYTKGLPKDLLLLILESVRADIVEIRQALGSIEMRMVAGSLLIIYEADFERAKEGVASLAERAALSVEHLEEDDEEEEEESDDEGPKKIGRPYIVKLIDFAHTKIVPGQGPDQGVLLGVDTTLKLLDGRIAQVRGAT